MPFENSAAHAQLLDQQDELNQFRDRFFIPQVNGKDSIYLCGNSLGLQPKSVKDYFDQELNDWAKLGVEGHFHGKNPWKLYHHFFSEKIAKLVGAKPVEVVAMNSLTVNLNLALFSFYQPDSKRYKILMEAGAFPSDQYAVETIVRSKGFDPTDAIIEVEPEADHMIKDEKIKAQIENDSTIALVLLGGVNYYTGQLFDLEGIAETCRANGVTVGYDLAHAVGNVPLKLHEWKVDFAVWCTYKYLNSGPGSVGGMFIHENHAHKDLNRLAGWWGHKEDERFEMKKGFIPMPGAQGWQNSNAPVFNMAAHWASLDLFEEVGYENVWAKSIALREWMDFLLDANKDQLQGINLITPREMHRRGCQFSFLTSDSDDKKGKDVYDRLTEAGVICDWREPNVIRIAPVPLYNTFSDVFQFVNLLASNA